MKNAAKTKPASLKALQNALDRQEAYTKYGFTPEAEIKALQEKEDTDAAVAAYDAAALAEAEAAKPQRTALVTVDPYVRSHGKMPRGFGSWAFCFDRENYTEIDQVFFVNPSCTYTDALKAAKQEGLARGARFISVQP